jgi:hypothetical protein
MQRFTTASTVWTASAIALIAGVATLSSHVGQSAPVQALLPVAAAAAPVVNSTPTVLQRTTSAAAAVAKSTAAATRSAAAAVAAVAANSPATPPAIRIAAAPAAAIAFAVGSEKELRAKIKWVPIRWDGEKTLTLDQASRLMLAQAAAEHAGLDKVGLSYEDVYGVIDAETSWVPRSGMGRNGVSSHGLAQFEPRTARGLGLKDPDDPVQAVYAAAVNMKHGAEWAADRLEGLKLKLSPQQYSQKLREGVSVYYNLSIRGRNKWDGLNTAQLPIETQRHIRNVRAGAEKASDIAEEIFS